MKKASSLIVAAALVGALGLTTTNGAGADQQRARQPQRTQAPHAGVAPRTQVVPRTQAAPVQRLAPRKARSLRHQCRVTCRTGRGRCIKANYAPEACGNQSRQCYRACKANYPATQYAPGYPLGR